VGIVKTRGIPPYPIEEHYIVLTAAKERWGKKFFYYNDPSYDSTLLREGERELEKPADWLVKKGVLESYLIYK